MNTNGILTEYYKHLKETGSKEEIEKFEKEWSDWCEERGVNKYVKRISINDASCPDQI